MDSCELLFAPNSARQAEEPIKAGSRAIVFDNQNQFLFFVANRLSAAGRIFPKVKGIEPKKKNALPWCHLRVLAPKFFTPIITGSIALEFTGYPDQNILCPDAADVYEREGDELV